MGKSLRLYGIDKRTLRLASALADDRCEWDDLSREEKMRIAGCPYDLTGITDKRRVEIFKLQMRAERGEKITERMLARAKLALDTSGIRQITIEDNNNE